MGIGPFRLANLKRVSSNPRAVAGAFSYIGQMINIKYYEKTGRPPGCDVIKEDWDTLIILDGCRFDTFEEMNWIDGTLESRKSRGSESLEFLEANFIGRELHDTIYITTNPYGPNIPKRTFHAMVNLLETDWDNNLNTVPPDAVIEAARDAIERFPNKRMIFHFMQPHYPFIGEVGQDIDESGFSPEGVEDESGKPPWRRLRFSDSEISETEIRQSYRENLRLVLNEVEEILPVLDGRTIITSDHGNLIGDRLRPIPTRGYGHPQGLYVPELITVPWHIHNNDPRRDVIKEPPVKNEMLSDGIIEDRLDALGYR